MLIYFAGSIRAGRGDAGLYHRMIEYMQRSHTVLTSHVGDPDLQEDISDRQIFLRDMEWMRQADVLIAECSCPSHGVGYELARAEQLAKPTFIFYNKERPLSAMLTGDPFFHICPYGREEEIYPELDRILNEA
ncbi:MAG: nucleoside 2-deoxyribosyltransferase [Clostridia bacterium]|nr:nucleoside 2-deoxyribosyltransferase [Clostridia bacterium]